VSAVRAVARVEARLVRHDWNWAESARPEIDRNWDRRRESKPAIFDGRILMVASTRLEGDLMRVDFFETSYRNLLAHMDLGAPDASVSNGFGMGALTGRDGGFVLGIMADHTANAGKLYFPCGTPDLSDVLPDGTVDLSRSILREIHEETGLGANDCALGAGWVVVRQPPRTAFMRQVDLAFAAEEAANRIRAHMASEGQPELAEIVVLRGAAALNDSRMPDFLPAYFRFALGL
jgi:8-oxo-dGTP pyrophosphatase MutT (NUDIX family)